MAEMALIDEATGLVDNIVVAEETDPVPPGKRLAKITDPECEAGWLWTPAGVVPPASVIAVRASKQDALSAALWDTTGTISAAPLFEAAKGLAGETANSVKYTDADGTVRFDVYRGGRFWIGYYEINEGVPGARAKAKINKSFELLFTRTNALGVVGYIDLDNLAAAAMAPQILGYKLETMTGFKLVSYTLARWATAYGVNEAVALMQAHGQADKADLLLTRLGMK